jgi:hypothetical protein
MRHSGFSIAIMPLGLAHEGDEDDVPPDHHAKDYEGDFNKWCDCNVAHHKEMALHYMSAKEGDNRAADEHAKEAAKHLKQANKIQKAAERQQGGDDVER